MGWALSRAVLRPPRRGGKLGTGSAVLVCFRRDIASIVKVRWVWTVRPEYRKDPEARMGWFVIVGALPVGILGVTSRTPSKSACVACGSWLPC
ncbi:undecaprenyl-diphosphate phosphatase [Streptomyces bungoensis]